jgi:pyruvate ferredoxin oxidoreductase delta subunit
MSEQKVDLKEKYALKDWQNLPDGGVIVEAGNANDYETGSWRTWKPVCLRENCTQCLKCWEYCPDNAIVLEDGVGTNGEPRKLVKEVNYYHCKGCGICVKECPVNKEGKVKALDFVRDEV